MLIFELILSLIIWSMTFLPINEYVFGADSDLPIKIAERESSLTIDNVNKLSAEIGFTQNDLCEDVLFDNKLNTEELNINNPFVILYDNLPVRATSTETVALTTDGQNLFIALNSASTTDYDLISYDLNNLNFIDYNAFQNSTSSINAPFAFLNSGPGLNGLISSGKNIFGINSSINSAIQKFKLSNTESGGFKVLNKVGDYKLPQSSSMNPVYASKISIAYPNILLGLKKNLSEEFLAIDLEKMDKDFSLAINNKTELDSSVNFILPFFEKYSHVFVSSAKEPEIQDFCLDCNATSGFDIFGSLGNVRSVIYKNNYLFVGRSTGNEELFKIKRQLDDYEIIESVDIEGGVISMIVLGNLLIVATGGDNSKIQIRKTDEINTLLMNIESHIAIRDLECVGGGLYGVGNMIEKAHDVVKKIRPIIFKIQI